MSSVRFRGTIVVVRYEKGRWGMGQRTRAFRNEEYLPTAIYYRGGRRRRRTTEIYTLRRGGQKKNGDDDNDNGL